MIPGPHRMKGGATQLSVTHPGALGPFGTRPDDREDDEQRQHPPETGPDQPEQPAEELWNGKSR